ncbi:MAG: 3-dehydroquinate synthase [Pyrinomonadaceae bacterium]|nr:3-dehydroquinate synthase [Pyrinomonadaceae bacterium]
MNETVKVALKSHPHQYEIKIGNNLLADSGVWAKSCLANSAKKIVVISNPKVFSLYGEKVAESLKNQGFEVLIHKIGDGEKYKNLRTLEKTLDFFSRHQLKRSDAVIALGGGVVGDLTGFASSIYLRGISFLQIPTTLLSMIDSSVGGKTGVNSNFGKNLIGTFHQPNGVLIDVDTLKTLPRRELTAGFCEAVKQGAIANPNLFNQTSDFLKKYSPNHFKKYFFSNLFLTDLQKLIASQVAFKAEIVKGDERENLEKSGNRSRKILNFGHTVGHALEKVTNYKYFKHGEAVGIGILVAGEISKRVANLVQNELNLLNDVVKLTGSLPNWQNIETKNIIEAFEFDKKNVGDSLQWILLEKIGQPIIYPNSKIPDSVIIESISAVVKKSTCP